MNDLSRNLLIQMAKRDIRTIKELEKLTGVSRVTLSKILNGYESVSLTTIIRLCHGLDCDVCDLVRVKEVV